MSRGREEVGRILAEVDLFASLGPERLAWLAGEAEPLHLEAGEEIVHAGQSPTHFNVLVEGQIDFVTDIDGRLTVINSHTPVNYSGTMNLLTGEPLVVTGRVPVASEILRFRRDTLFALIRDEPEVMQEIVRQFRPNMQRFQAIERQREKLASLGSLAAGLAHEINNPAAAARAAVGDLRRSVATLRGGAPGLAGLDADALQAVGRAACTVPEHPGDEDPLAVADREEELGTWLEAHGVAAAWELASALAGAGLDVGWASGVAAAVPSERLGEALRWAAAGSEAGGLLGELTESLRRVSELVGAIKAYSYMDQAPEQEVDIHEGLESTLTLLAHKFKRAQTKVERHYDRSLPPITAAGAELNQVWTNLLDNAIAAAPGGHVSVTTRGEDGYLAVEVADDGTGIPPEDLPRLFDPFFTTKAVGEGTGLGLDVSWRVVVDHHRGQLTVASEPGDTRFTVLLPLAAS